MSSESPNIIATRFSDEFNKLPISGIELSKKIGVSKGTIYNWQEKGNIPADKLAAMEDYGIDAYYVLTGQRNPNTHTCAHLKSEIANIETPASMSEIIDMIDNASDYIELESDTDGHTGYLTDNFSTSLKSVIKKHLLTHPHGDDFVLVPRYDVQASAGHGAMIHSEQIIDRIPVPLYLLRKDLGLKPDKLSLINAAGDSMEPAIFNNDLLLVDLGSNSLTEDAIYVLSFDGLLLVKRIQRMLNGSVVVKSDNPIYDNQTLKKEELSDLRVLGRVVWFGRYM